MTIPTPEQATQRDFISDRRIFENILILLGNSAISQGLTAITLFLTAHQLEANEFGKYAAVFAFTSISSVFFNLGLDTWLLREGGKDNRQIPSAIGKIFQIKICGGLIWYTLIIIIAPIVIQDSLITTLLRLSGLSVLLDSLFMTTLTAFKAVLRNNLTILIESSSDALWFLGTMILITMGVKNTLVFVQIRVAVLALSLAISLIVIQQVSGIVWGTLSLNKMMKEVLPYSLSDISALAIMRIDIVIVALILGSYSVGVYSPAVSIINGLFWIPASIYSVFIPVLGIQFDLDKHTAWKTVDRGTAFLVVIGIGMCLTVFVGSDWITGLLGPSFAPTSIILRYLSVILIIKSISYVMASVLVAGGLQSRRVLVQIGALIFNVSANLFLIGTYGIIGVAVVYILTEVYTLLGYSMLAVRFRFNTST